MPVITTLWRLRQGDHKFDTALEYIVSLCLKKKKSENKTSKTPDKGMIF